MIISNWPKVQNDPKRPSTKGSRDSHKKDRNCSTQFFFTNKKNPEISHKNERKSLPMRMRHTNATIK